MQVLPDYPKDMTALMLLGSLPAVRISDQYQGAVH